MSDTGINVTPAMYRQKATELADLYERISQASGNKTAGKRAIANRLVEANQETVNNIVNQITEFLSGLDDSALAGVYTGLTKQVEATFDSKVSAFLEAEANSNKTEVTPISPEELVTLTEEYKTGVKDLGLLKSVLAMFRQDDQIADIPDPKRMTGARGPRGKRALSQFVYSIGKDQLPADEQSVTKIAKANGFEDSVDENGKKVTAGSQLKALILSRIKVEDPSELPDEWSVKLPNNKTLNAIKLVDEDDDEDEEEEEAVA